MRFRKYTPLVEKRRIERECAWCWYVLGLCLAVVFGALTFFYLSVVVPFVSFRVETVQASTNEEVCEHLERYTNGEQFEDYCKNITE